MKTVIITGTSSGIGLDLVKIFDSNGYRVISLSRNDLPNTTNFSENVNHINFDITNNSDVNSLVVLIKSKYSNIALLINNAGKLISTAFGDFSDSESHWKY